MRFLKAALYSFAVAALTVAIAAAEEYYIKVIPREIKGFKVEARIETNIPGSMYINTRFYLKNQKPEEAFIGTGLVRVPLSGGKATMVIDGEKKAIPHGFPLPDGTYEIEVVYTHLWPSNTAVTKATGITRNIKGTATVELGGSAKSSSIPTSPGSSSGARWVMENVYRGYLWDPGFWQNKFGEIVEIEYRGSGDTNILTVYYVKAINMSLLVDLRKNLILKYSMGVSHE